MVIMIGLKKHQYFFPACAIAGKGPGKHNKTSKAYSIGFIRQKLIIFKIILSLQYLSEDMPAILEKYDFRRNIRNNNATGS